jgi:hypothetical protein
MTLLDAQKYDFAKQRRRRIMIGVGVAVVLVLLVVGWTNRYWREKRIGNQFFAALQKKDYEAAYGIYFADPGWKQHQQNHSQYPYSDFYRDWGPGGDWGVIQNYEVYGASNCPGSGRGVVVDVIVNHRAEHAQVWVESGTHAISLPPCTLEFR